MMLMKKEENTCMRPQQKVLGTETEAISALRKQAGDLVQAYTAFVAFRLGELRNLPWTLKY